MEPVRRFALSVTKQKSREVGGCNFCSRHTTEHGEIDHEVYVVKARHQGSLVVRFCPSCAEEFDLMTEGPPPPKPKEVWYLHVMTTNGTPVGYYGGGIPRAFESKRLAELYIAAYREDPHHSNYVYTLVSSKDVGFLSRGDRPAPKTDRPTTKGKR